MGYSRMRKKGKDEKQKPLTLIGKKRGEKNTKGVTTRSGRQ